MSGHLKVDPLFLGLTRPATVLGVSFTFFGLNALTAILYFIITSDFKIAIFAVLSHLFGMALSKKEPLAAEIFITKIQKCNGGQNKSFYRGLHSYGLF